MIKIPIIQSPHLGPKIVRAVVVDWPACEEHGNCLLVRRHPESLLLWCSCGQHFITQSDAVMIKTKAHEIGAI